MDQFEKLLSDTLAARGRSKRTQETYGLMLRLFARFVEKPLDQDVPRISKSISATLRASAS